MSTREDLAPLVELHDGEHQRASKPRASTIAADDGTAIAVEEVGPADSSMTVVFAHGFCLEMASWEYQRAHLHRQWGAKIRMVFYDQRGHGRSGVPSTASCTMAQLGDDLAAVIRTVAPIGPLVLVGHSMGGMSVLAYANRHGRDVRDRVVGIGLVSTACRGLTDGGVGLLLDTRIVDLFCLATRLAPGVVHAARTALGRIVSPVVAATCSGEKALRSRAAMLTDKLISDTDTRTIANFLPALKTLNEHGAMEHLLDVPVLILCGKADVITPFEHSARMAGELPNAVLRGVVGAGHMVELERPHLVSGEISRLIERAFDECTAGTVQEARCPTRYPSTCCLRNGRQSLGL